MSDTMELYPLRFTPIYKERVWGGRRLADVYGRPLPPGARIGESWERARARFESRASRLLRLGV